MEKFVSVDEMISIEKALDASGHTYSRMMALAGKSLAENIVFACRHINAPNVLGLVGVGNNGGDTLVAMVHLLRLGWKCNAFLVKEREDDPLQSDFINNGGNIYVLEADKDLNHLRQLVSECNILVDGVLGTGIHLPLRAPVPTILQTIKESIDVAKKPPYVVAVDCPSGVDSDKGTVSEDCIQADLTVCMAAVKRGLLMLPAFGYLGELVVGDIGIDEDLPEWKNIKRIVLGDWIGQDWIQKRPMDGHKGTFGTVQVIAGSKNYSGAVLLAGKAAFRSGAGWVNLCVPEFLHPALTTGFPEATWLPVSGDQNGFNRGSAKVIHRNLNKADVVLLGPGLSLEPAVRGFVDALVSENLPPMVLDADGLKLLNQIENWWTKIPGESILTPHPGEMSILTGITVKDIQDDRIAVTEKFSKSWNQVVVLKGAFTVVADPFENTAILPVATPALARAGTGDVLAGIIAGFRAQGLEAFQAACAGVWYHAQAGLFASKTLGSDAGVLASDLIECLPTLLPY